jgi:hypothetical protein
MSDRYRVIQRSDRGGMCYCVDTQTDSRTSLETKDRKEAERLVFHKNEALREPAKNRKIGMIMLTTPPRPLCSVTRND